MNDQDLLVHHQKAQAPLNNPAHKVYFLAGLLACREQMARMVEPQNAEIAQSIRLKWWPEIGADPGVPRLLNFNEVCDGGDEGPWLRKEIEPSVEALPLAAQFIGA